MQLSTSWEPYDLTAGTLVVLPEGGPHAGAGVLNRMAAIGVTVSHAVEQPEPRQATAEEASQPGEGSQQDEQPVARGHRVSHGEHLVAGLA